MPQKRNIILVGPMGAGKSTIGRRLANLLGREFVDSDKQIEARTGVDIPTIFEFEQEDGFRDRESAVIEELTRREGIVLATGGGAVLRPANRQHMKERGFVIYLRTSVDEQLRRTAHDRNRPLLQTADPRAKLEALLAERAPLYTEVADLIVDTDRGNARALAQRIVKRLRQAMNDTL
jgi:shikimate kinase